jgi:hypothetical protein
MDVANVVAVPVSPMNSNPIPQNLGSSCCERIRVWFASFQIHFDQSSVGRLYNKTIVLSPLIYNIFTCISSVINGQFFNKLIGLFWEVKDIVEIGLQRFEWLFAAIKSAKVFAVTVLPLALFCAAKSAYDMVMTNEKIDAFLNMLASLGWFGDSSSYFVTGLQSLGVLGLEAANLAFTLSVIGAFLSSSTFLLNAKYLYQGENLFQEVLEIERKTKDNSHDAVFTALLSKSDYELNQHFGIWGHDLRQKIQRVLHNLTPNENSKQLVDILKGRIQSRNFSHKMAMTSAAVTCVGMPIILFTTMFTLGYGFLAWASIIAICGFLGERAESIKLKKSLGLSEY